MWLPEQRKIKVAPPAPGDDGYRMFITVAKEYRFGTFTNEKYAMLNHLTKLQNKASGAAMACFHREGPARGAQYLFLHLR